MKSAATAKAKVVRVEETLVHLVPDSMREAETDCTMTSPKEVKPTNMVTGTAFARAVSNCCLVKAETKNCHLR